VTINALVGFFQEYRSERAVLALRSMTAPRARVLRDGSTQLLPAAQSCQATCCSWKQAHHSADAQLIERTRSP